MEMGRSLFHDDLDDRIAGNRVVKFHSVDNGQGFPLSLRLVEFLEGLSPGHGESVDDRAIQHLDGMGQFRLMTQCADLLAQGGDVTGQFTRMTAMPVAMALVKLCRSIPGLRKLIPAGGLLRIDIHSVEDYFEILKITFLLAQEPRQ